MRALAGFLEKLLSRYSPVQPTINEQLVAWNRRMRTDSKSK